MSRDTMQRWSCDIPLYNVVGIMCSVIFQFVQESNMMLVKEEMFLDLY